MKSYYEMTKAEKEKYQLHNILGENQGFLNSAEVAVDNYFENKKCSLKFEREIAKLFDMSSDDMKYMSENCKDEVVRDFIIDIYKRIHDDLLDMIATKKISNGHVVYKELYPTKDVEETKTKVDF